jgi:hypothetical protein
MEHCQRFPKLLPAAARKLPDEERIERVNSVQMHDWMSGQGVINKSL